MQTTSSIDNPDLKQTNPNLHTNTEYSNISTTKNKIPYPQPNNTSSTFGNKLAIDLDKLNDLTSQKSLYSSNIDTQFDKLYVSSTKPCVPSSNIYTKDHTYIKNKQMTIVPKCICSNSKFKYFKLNPGAVPQLIPIKHKSSTLYKTTIFRNHHLITDKPKQVEHNTINTSQPKPKRRFRNYFYEELAKKRLLKKEQQKLYKPSDSLYKELNVKCNEAYKNYISQDKRNKKDIIAQDQIVKTFESSWLINRKYKDDIPLVFPITLRDNNLFSSKSEETRHDKVNDELLKIKYLINLEKDKKKKKEIIVEYLKERNIEPENITETAVQNFLHFIQSDFRIDIQKSLKDNILSGISNEYNEHKPTFVTERHFKVIPKQIQDKNNDQIEIKINREPLDTCLEAQTNLTWNKPPKNDNVIMKELNEELEQIKEESRLNKQIACKVHKFKYKHKHFPTEEDFYGKPVADLRLGFEEPEDAYEDAVMLTEPVKPKKDLDSIVQRLYYSNIEKNPNFYLDIYKKKRKLLEYIMLERTKSKINYEMFKSQYKNIV